MYTTKNERVLAHPLDTAASTTTFPDGQIVLLMHDSA
jgi:hypothetical protein